jgi:hypothetical protein
MAISTKRKTKSKMMSKSKSRSKSSSRKHFSKSRKNLSKTRKMQGGANFAYDKPPGFNTLPRGASTMPSDISTIPKGIVSNLRRSFQPNVTEPTSYRQKNFKNKSQTTHPFAGPNIKFF